MTEVQVPRSPTKAEAALGLLLAGATYPEIVRALKYANEETCRHQIERELARGVTDNDRIQHRSLASARYERLLRAVWGKAINPDDPQQMVAVRHARELTDRLVALHGSAQPQQLVVSTPTTAQLMEWIARAENNGPPPVVELDPFDIQDAVVVEEDTEGHEGEG